MEKAQAENNQAGVVNDSLVNVLSSSMTDLGKHNVGAYQLLIQRAREGFFEQHQSSGRMGSLADELLAASSGEAEADENPAD